MRRNNFGGRGAQHVSAELGELICRILILILIALIDNSDDKQKTKVQ